MRKFISILLALILNYAIGHGQSFPINSQQFFLDDRVIEVSFTTDLKKLKSEKKVPAWQSAHISMSFSDSVQLSEVIQVQPRGHFRKDNCDLSSLMLQFKNATSPKLSRLKRLKLVGGCNPGTSSEELLLKEFMLYKIYNHLTSMSFRVRLLHVNYKDSRQKAKPYSQYAFLLENIGELAKRNNCREMDSIEFHTESTNRQHTTLVAIFEYMIGNTDWSVPKYHNIKLLVPNNDTMAHPYVVPYDFDYTGSVNAPYAIPIEQLGINSIRERVYRGFGRTLDELNIALEIFKSKKEVILYTINNFTLLKERVRRDMIDYIEDFYKTIGNKREVKSIFIDGARKD